VITKFALPDHLWMAVEMGIFLYHEARFDGYADCGFPPFPESCATVQLENLDAWEQWREMWSRPTWWRRIGVLVRGDCRAAHFIAGPFLGLEGFIAPYIDCSTSSLWGQTIDDESMLGAQVSVEDCEWTAATATSAILSCRVPGSASAQPLGPRSWSAIGPRKGAKRSPTPRILGGSEGLQLLRFRPFALVGEEGLHSLTRKRPLVQVQ
jgi:hypothetical protein